MYLYILTFLHGIMEHRIYIIFNILYETYDSILQFVHFSANSHNVHINTVMTVLYNLIFDIYMDYNAIILHMYNFSFVIFLSHFGYSLLVFHLPSILAKCHAIH